VIGAQKNRVFRLFVIITISFIKFYSKLENLHLVGLFVRELPVELEELPNLENISFAVGDVVLCPKS